MNTIVLDYEQGGVYVVNHSANLQIEEVETLLTETYHFSLEAIEWMTVKDIYIQYLPATM